MAYISIQYPSYVYPTSPTEIALVVRSSAEAQAIVVAPTPTLAVTTPTTQATPVKATIFSTTPTVAPAPPKGKDK